VDENDFIAGVLTEVFESLEIYAIGYNASSRSVRSGSRNSVRGGPGRGY